jgi:hypothetical protein
LLAFVDSRKIFGKGLFLIPTDTIVLLKEEGEIPKSEMGNVNKMIETVNLATFAIKIFTDTEICINNFFVSVTFLSMIYTDEEISFYLNLRVFAFKNSFAEKKENYDLEEKFPSDIKKYFLVKGKSANKIIEKKIIKFRRSVV